MPWLSACPLKFNLPSCVLMTLGLTESASVNLPVRSGKVSSCCSLTVAVALTLSVAISVASPLTSTFSSTRFSCKGGVLNGGLAGGDRHRRGPGFEAVDGYLQLVTSWRQVSEFEAPLGIRDLFLRGRVGRGPGQLHGNRRQGCCSRLGRKQRSLVPEMDAVGGLGGRVRRVARKSGSRAKQSGEQQHPKNITGS